MSAWAPDAPRAAYDASIASIRARILDGEAPYDLFVRWKPLSKQAKGWQPDLNDGVRMNIRGRDMGSFVEQARGVANHQPRSLQLYGSDPVMVGEAVRKLCGEGRMSVAICSQASSASAGFRPWRVVSVCSMTAVVRPSSCAVRI